MRNLYVILVLMGTALSTSATWDSYQNNQKVAYVDGEQFGQQLVHDNAGGCYVVWQDGRLGNNIYQVYAQHFDSLGNPSWQVDGIALAPTSKFQKNLQVFGDGADGVIAVWTDHRDSISSTSTNVDLWGQRINQTGNLQWGSLGKSLVTEAGEQSNPLFVSDGSDGFVLAWKDGGNSQAGRQSGYWMQRFDVSGKEQWTKGGVMIHQVGNVFSSSHQWTMCSDGQKGAVLVFNESGTNTEQASNIYGHRVDSDGKRHWTSDIDTIAGTYFIERGYPINKGKGNDNFPIAELGPDGELYVSWEGKREISAQHGTLFVQKMHINGDLLWDIDGVKITSLDVSNQFDMLLDHKGGIYFNYAVDKVIRRDLIRFDTAGKKDWVSPVTINDDISAMSKMKRTQFGDVYIAWTETSRNQNSQNAIVVQRFNSNGEKMISGDEVISTYPEDKTYLVIEIGRDDALFCAWGDYRRTNGQSSGNADVDLYIQRYVPSGTVGIQNKKFVYGSLTVIDGEAFIQILVDDLHSQSGEVSIIDIMGRLCFSTTDNQIEKRIEINATHLKTGIYTAILKTEEGIRTVKFHHQ